MEDTEDKNTYTFIFEGVKVYCEPRSSLLVLIKTPTNIWLVPLRLLTEFNKKHQPDKPLKVTSSWFYSLNLSKDTQGFSMGYSSNLPNGYLEKGLFMKANHETKEYEYISPEECLTLCMVMGYL